MPYVAINAGLKISDAQKEKIKTELGRLISIIPTKSEAGLLVDFADSKTTYKAGVGVPCAFIDVRIFRKAEFEPKKKFTEEVFELITRELGIKKEHMCLSITENECWGFAGSFHKSDE